MRFQIATALVVIVSTSLLLAEDKKTRQLIISKADVGSLPKGWKAAKTGKGDGSVWKVVADDTAPSKKGAVLAQTAESPKGLFNLCIDESADFKDLEMEVSFKAMAGETDQGGGLIWRCQDADNYYIARMNPLESNFRLYKVVAGKRTQLDTKEGIKIPTGEWHTIAIVHMGNQIECKLDGKSLLKAQDDTFSGKGKIGLWTKADAQTRFDRLKVSAE